jgi:hypothetical protein
MTQKRIWIMILLAAFGTIAAIGTGLSLSRQAERRHNAELLNTLRQCEGKPFYLCEPLNRADIEWEYYSILNTKTSTSEPALELIYQQTWSTFYVRIENDLIVEAGASVDWSRP